MSACKLPAFGFAVLMALTSIGTAAQTPKGSQPAAAPFDVPAAPPTTAQAEAFIAERFKAADANHNGKLTRDEAQAGMPKVYENFDKIDVKKQGYVTERQIGAYWTKKTKDQMQKEDPSWN
ncbi:EF-hand domain-containing protein [Cupriavidus sp. WGlv3]|uniref:EF-hand domain-containing protein n=1 Tax=Cupriavidus sp. WGlv3 TaxID=2919924 RepID=UPI002090BD17|nr:EF-hand domain-containing protein [Cupriavidus sp. WGlv3]MCO4865504.1 EF-hand domain-containing protein [Cupriavidus sp. WGlv3]